MDNVTLTLRDITEEIREALNGVNDLLDEVERDSDDEELLLDLSQLLDDAFQRVMVGRLHRATN